MEIAAVNDDDSEPAKGPSAKRASDEESVLFEKLDELRLSQGQFTIVIDGYELVCEETILVEGCKYFEAFTHFEKSRRIHIKGGVNFNTFKAIVDFLSTKALELDLDNCQDILHASLFLQCQAVEDLAVAFISERLARDNAFKLYNLGRNLGCTDLVEKSKFFIEKCFAALLIHFSRAGSTDAFLNTSIERLCEVLGGDLQISEDLLLLALLGWIELKGLSEKSRDLLDLINWCLLTPSCIDALEEEEMLEERLSEVRSFQKLSLAKQADFWRSHPKLVGRRWPKLVIAVSTGAGGSQQASSKAQSGLHFLDLCKAPSTWQWHSLAKKPPDLRKRGAGATVVYHHPRIYFLGGEQRWQLDWFDLEEDKWGVGRGTPPGRLLAGAVVFQGAIYLIGGVAVEDWGGPAGSKGQVVTSDLVDVYHVEEGKWIGRMPLDEARSSPGVAALGDWIYVIGGLQKRRLLSSVCRYSPSMDCWENLKPLPIPIVYSAIVVRENLIWVLGGMDSDYQPVSSCWSFDTMSLAWNPGPKLQQVRRGAFGFLHANRMFVCGGTGPGLKYLDSAEALDDQSGEWEKARVPVKMWNSPVIALTVKAPLRMVAGSHRK